RSCIDHDAIAVNRSDLRYGPTGSGGPGFALGADLADDPVLRFGIGDAIIGPASRRGFLRLQVGVSRGGVRSQVGDEQEVSPLPGAAGVAYVDMHVTGAVCERPEEALVVVAAAQLYAERLDRGNVGGFIEDVIDADLDVDHGFGF